MGRMTVADVGKKVDELGARVDMKIDTVVAEVQTAFDEMRMFVTESVGSLRTDMLGRFERVDQRFDGVDQRFAGIDKRFDEVDQRFDGVDQRFDRMDRRFDRIEDKLDRVLSRRPTTPRRRRKP